MHLNHNGLFWPLWAVAIWPVSSQVAFFSLAQYLLGYIFRVIGFESIGILLPMANVFGHLR